MAGTQRAKWEGTRKAGEEGRHRSCRPVGRVVLKKWGSPRGGGRGKHLHFGRMFLVFVRPEVCPGGTVAAGCPPRQAPRSPGEK